MSEKIIPWGGALPELASNMTLRDYFAAAALTGLLSYWQQTQQTERDFAKDAYLLADAMLAARARKEAQP